MDLGAQVKKDGVVTLGIKRTALAYARPHASFNRLNEIWRAEDISRRTKVLLFKTLVLSVLLYGCETWKLKKSEEKKLHIFQNKCLRRILRIRWQQDVTNKKVLRDGRNRPNKRGEKEEMLLDWACPEERSEQRLCCCPWMEARGEEEQRQTQNNLASHCGGESERQGWNTWTKARQTTNNLVSLWRRERERQGWNT